MFWGKHTAFYAAKKIVLGLSHLARPKKSKKNKKLIYNKELQMRQ